MKYTKYLYDMQIIQMVMYNKKYGKELDKLRQIINDTESFN